jgi:hypothetical protein
MPVLAGHNYSIPTLSQPNYNASRYQVGADVFDFADSLDPNRKADISSVPWLQNTTSFSHEYNNRLDLFYNTFAYAYQNDLVNIDTIKTTTCFGQETSRYPGAEAFNGNEALGYASMFCNGVVRTNLRYAVASTVSGNLTFMVSLPPTRDPEGTWSSPQSPTLPPLSKTESSSSFFEGDTDNAKVDHCVLTYKDIISHVSEQSDES